MAGTYHSFIGQERAALAAFRRDAPPRVVADASSLAGYAAEPATDAVVRLARDHAVVLVNEAHHVPRHRAFTRSLLRGLRELGFRYLALEALDERDSTLAARGYPVRATGFYTNEPAFGELIREALSLGYVLVPYEATGEDMRTQETREAAEARHLVARIFRRDPDARVLVHAGYTHIEESNTPGRASPMAVRLREATGIDPLSVDQVTMSDRGDSLYDDPRRSALVGHFRLREPFVIVRDGSCWSAKPGVHDLTVIAPPASEHAGRPGWLWSTADRRAYVVPATVARPETDCVVTARRAEESADAVPVDALRVGPLGASRTLALPPGRYVVEARDGAGRVLNTTDVTQD
jgi:hypothetical protein